jgi:cytochrome c oxidase accessory protein FixG
MSIAPSQPASTAPTQASPLHADHANLDTPPQFTVNHGGSASVLSTLNNDGSRRWLTPKPSPGFYASARKIVAWLLIAIFVAIPFIKINGKQALLLDLTTRRFHIAGFTFLPSDMILLALGMICVLLSIYLITALFGRVWCGWGCPQSVYLEQVFRPIDRFFDGTPGKLSKNALQRSPIAKPLKFATFIILSFLLANVFLSYFVGMDKLLTWMTRSPLEHPQPFIVVLVVTALMLFDFGFFREQTCLVVCPYGRFQSVLLDKNSLIVAYDYLRGEPRGRKLKKPALAAVPVDLTISAPPKQGDCIDCKQCVVTCPTGIDIRNGLQMECIHCTQCIDACNSIMDKVGKPRGLIGYKSQAMVAGQTQHFFRPRMAIYPAILAIVFTVFILVLINRPPAYLRVLRGLGKPYTLLNENMVANPVHLKIINRRDHPQSYTWKVDDGLGQITIDQPMPIIVQPGESVTLKGFVQIPMDVYAAKGAQGSMMTSITFGDEDGFARTFEWRHIGPMVTTPATKPATTNPKNHS